MSGHSRLSPSARHRWSLCPASVRACEQYDGKGTSSPHAVDGTHSHTLLEECIDTGVDAASLIGEIMVDHDGEFTVDEERAERVDFALKYIRSVASVNKFRVYAERRVSPFKLLGRDDMDGTVDVHMFNDRFLEVIDYKDGVGVVSAQDNPQLDQYVWGIISEHIDDDGAIPFQEIRMTIIQPKLREMGMAGIDSYTVSGEKFLEGYTRIIEEAAATDDPDAPFVPGEKQCKWCAHASNCKSLFESTMTKAGIKFDDLTQSAANADPSKESDERLVEMLDAIPLLKVLIANAEEEALRRMSAGKQLLGYKMVRGVGHRKWDLDDEQLEKMLVGMRIPKGMIYKKVIISPAQIEKLKWTDPKGNTKTLNDRQLKKILDNTARGEGKLTIAPLADKRPAVEPVRVEGMFPPVPDVPDASTALPDWLR